MTDDAYQRLIDNAVRLVETKVGAELLGPMYLEIGKETVLRQWRAESAVDRIALNGAGSAGGNAINPTSNKKQSPYGEKKGKI